MSALRGVKGRPLMSFIEFLIWLGSIALGAAKCPLQMIQRLRYSITCCKQRT
jgi:hypothetical protein